MRESFDTRVTRLERELIDDATGPVLILPEHGDAAQCLAEYRDRHGVAPDVVIYHPNNKPSRGVLDFGGPVVLLPGFRGDLRRLRPFSIRNSKNQALHPGLHRGPQ